MPLKKRKNDGNSRKADLVLDWSGGGNEHGLALLPRSGEANRDLIRQKAKDAKGYVEDKIQEGKDSVGEVAQKTKDTVSEAWTAARESAGKSKEESSDAG